jgi:hypothetical protein
VTGLHLSCDTHTNTACCGAVPLRAPVAGTYAAAARLWISSSDRAWIPEGTGSACLPSRWQCDGPEAGDAGTVRGTFPVPGQPASRSTACSRPSGILARHQKRRAVHMSVPMPNATHRRARSSSCPCSSTYLLAARAPPPAPPWLRRPSHPNAMQRLQLPSAATACAARRVLSHSFSPHSEAPSFFQRNPTLQAAGA